MSESNRESLIYVPETTLGTTPTNSANWKRFPFTGEALFDKRAYQSDETIRDDRGQADSVQVSATAEGTINFNLRAVTIDDILEAILGGTWASNVLKVGVTKRSFSLEKHFADLISGNAYELGVGLRMTQLALDMTYGKIATGVLTMAGIGWTDQAATAVGTGSVAANNANPAFNTTVDITAVKVDGAASALYFKSLALTLNANTRAKTAIGSLFPVDNAYGSAGVELKTSMYFDNRSIENKVRSGAPLSFEFTIGDGSNSYDILIPRCFATSRDGLGATKMDDDIVPSVTLSGAYDSATGSAIQITRTLAS